MDRLLRWFLCLLGNHEAGEKIGTVVGTHTEWNAHRCIHCGRPIWLTERHSEGVGVSK
jgi:hypothetical protein